MELKPKVTYMTPNELSSVIKYKTPVINNKLKDSVLLEGVHYIRPFGRRKILYIWEAVERTMLEGGRNVAALTDMAE